MQPFMQLASFSPRATTFAGSLSRAVCSSNAPNWMSIMTAAGFLASVFPLLPSRLQSATVLSSPALYELAQLGHHVGRIERARGLTAGMGAGVDVDGESGWL